MHEVRRLRPVLGTYVEIGARGDKASAEKAVTTAFDAIQTIHDLASFQEASSPLSILNKQLELSGDLHPELLLMLQLAQGMTRISNRLFNFTLGGSLVQAGVLPDHGGPLLLPSGDENDLQIIGRKARLLRPVRLTLDGIAKGFAVDRAIQALKRHGIPAGWVNAGGDLRAYGDCQLTIQRRELDDSLTLLGTLRDAAVATSALRNDRSERFPAHIVSAQSLVTDSVWTVLARKAWRADALTKVAALAPPCEREKRVESLGGMVLYPAEVFK